MEDLLKGYKKSMQIKFSWEYYPSQASQKYISAFQSEKMDRLNGPFIQQEKSTERKQIEQNEITVVTIYKRNEIE